MRQLCWPLLGIMFLSGCVLAPGQQLKLGDGWQSGTSDIDQNVTIKEITPRLVMQIEAEAPAAAKLPDALVAFRPDNYRIGPGDLLSITVWDHPELTTPAGQLGVETNGRLVRPDGSLYYPYIGAIAAQGKTPDALRTEIASRLVRFIDSPQVDVSVARFASQRVFLSGAFERNEPQSISTTPLSLGEVVSRAGIKLDQADVSSLQFKRDGQIHVLNLDALNSQGVDLNTLYLKDGDNLFLPFNDRRKVYVMGEVGSSQAITLKNKSISLADALGTVSGLKQDTAKASRVFVIRQSADAPNTGATVFRLDANSPVSWVMANRFPLSAGDIVYVETAGLVRLNRLINGVFPVSFFLQAVSNFSQ